jgi:hypothetical protein
MNDPKPVSAEDAAEAINNVADKATSSVIEHQLADQIRGLRAGLEMQIKVFPDAKYELVKLVGTWINEAESALTTFRETGVAPSIDTEELVARAKRRYWGELIVVRQVYPGLPIVALHDAMCAEIDAHYPAHLKRLADERSAYQDRTSDWQNAAVKQKIAEMSEQKFIQDATDQL